MGKIHKARVFEGHKCTTGIHNALLDVVMPELSATAWKILCVVIRQTTGWDREEQGASYADLMLGTGIRSKATIAACLSELKSYRYQLITIQPGRQHEESKYTVNRDVEIDWIPQNFAYSSGSKNEPLRQSSGSKNEPNYGSKNEPLRQSSGSKNELSYMKESINLKEIGNTTTAAALPLTPVAVYEKANGRPLSIREQELIEEAISITETDAFAKWLNGYTATYGIKGVAKTLGIYRDQAKKEDYGTDFFKRAGRLPVEPAKAINQTLTGQNKPNVSAVETGSRGGHSGGVVGHPQPDSARPASASLRGGACSEALKRAWANYAGRTDEGVE